MTVASGNHYVLKGRNTSSDLDKEFDLLMWVRQSGLPVAVPIRAKTGRVCVVVNDDV